MEARMEVYVRIIWMIHIVWHIQGCPIDDCGRPFIRVPWEV